MKSDKVFITDYVSNPDIERTILGDALSKTLKQDIEVLLVWHEHIDKIYCKHLSNLKAVIRYGVGYDSLDLSYLKSRGIIACNTPDYGTEEVADTAIAMILNIARGISRYDFLCRYYSDSRWQENTLQCLKRNSDLTVGIIGAGRIGGSVVQRANSLRFKTVFYDKYKERGYEKLLGTTRVESIDELLKISDIVTIHVPLTEETHGLVDDIFLSKMKKGASLVNTARGKIVKDVDVFFNPLKSGYLSCVALDVLPEEPPKETYLIQAWKNRETWLDGRFLINPHTAYYSQRAFFEMRQKAAENALRVLNGKTPFNQL